MEIKEFLYRVKEWDQKLLLKYNGIGGSILTYILKFISFFGRETIWFLILAYFLFIWYDPFLFINFGTTFLMGLCLIVPFKEGIKRPRPFEIMPNVKLLERKQKSGSFPSWHCYNIMSQGLLISIILNSLFLMILFIVLTILMSFSRIYLGVHYPSDVVIGSLLGIVGFILSYFIFAPLFYELIIYLERFSVRTIYYKQLNPQIFTEPWYTILCIGVFIAIIFSALFKVFENKFFRK
ncbi:MAG: phosphatase PAP2 family protein [Promethearchaeia archaeon]